MDRKEIIEKIQKLLSLANSSNEHEAKLAAQKATELLTKYNLSMQEVETSQREYDSIHYAGDKSRMPAEHKYIFGLLQRFFFVKVVRGRKPTYDPKTGMPKRVITWSFFGQQHNVKIAHFVFAFLDNTFHNLYKVYQKNNETNRASRNSFYLGLYRGLVEQLDAGKKKVENETGLVVVPDPGIDKFINDSVGKTRSVPSRNVRSVDSEAYHKGVEEGKKIRIAMGLDQGPSNSGKALGGKL